MDWSLLACGRGGHVTFRPDETDLAERLHVTTPAGDSWRCLRCGTFVPGEPSTSGPASEAPRVIRGRMLRDLVIMRLLAVERVIEGFALIVAAIAVWAWQGYKGTYSALLSRELPILQQAAEQFGWDLQHSLIAKWALDIANVSTGTLALLGGFLILYGLMRWVEAVGLWLAKRWGEYLAVVLTTVFLPWEIAELLHHVTVMKAVLLLVNIAAVVWLVWTKYLFGARGGRAALERSLAEVSILEVERAAAQGEPDG